MPTPNMDEFDIIHYNKNDLIEIVKKLCLARKFKVNLYQEKAKANVPCPKLKFKCSNSPYYANKGKWTIQNTKNCPFQIQYLYNYDEEEYYLGDYDEMHNHALILDPKIMPLISKNQRKPIYQTPQFFRFSQIQADCLDALTHQVLQLAKERSFDLSLYNTSTPAHSTPDSAISIKGHYKGACTSFTTPLLNPSDLLFCCTFMVHATCQPMAMQKCLGMKTVTEQKEATMLARQYQMRNAQGKENQYLILKCPFKVIYKRKDDGIGFELIRYQDKHIHMVDSIEETQDF